MMERENLELFLPVEKIWTVVTSLTRLEPIS
jgi:hypothetical protein